MELPSVVLQQPARADVELARVLEGELADRARRPVDVGPVRRSHAAAVDETRIGLRLNRGARLLRRRGRVGRVLEVDDGADGKDRLAELGGRRGRREAGLERDLVGEDRVRPEALGPRARREVVRALDLTLPAVDVDARARRKAGLPEVEAQRAGARRGKRRRPGERPVGGPLEQAAPNARDAPAARSDGKPLKPTTVGRARAIPI